MNRSVFATAALCRATVIALVAMICLAAGCTQAQQMGSSGGEPYHVGVWFFTFWNSVSDTPQLTNARKVYGRSDPWAGVRDYAQGHGPVSLAPADAFANREPMIGFYDLMSQDTVDTEIDEAASEGIDFFAFYWYFDPNTGAESTASAPTSKFFASNERGRMKFLISPLSMGGFNVKVSLATWRGAILPKLINYMASDAYFRVNGRPVLVDFSIPMATPQDKATAYADLRAASEKRFGADPIILYLDPPEYTPAQTQYIENAAHPDGFTCFGFPISRQGEPYSEYTSGWIGELEHQFKADNNAPPPPFAYVPCGSIGQDSRPWYGIEWRGAKVPTYTADLTPAAFANHLQQLKSFIDSGQVNTFHTVILYAWNEWGEAAEAIEPSKKDGYTYADVIRRVFGLHPRGPRPSGPDDQRRPRYDPRMDDHR